MRLLEASPQEARRAHFARAEKLAMAAGADASRAATLGWIFNRMGAADGSIPLLQHAIKAATDDDLKQRAAFTLFESHLDRGDWRAAESLFGLAQKRLGPKEDPEWLGRIALIAAQKGAPKDAMRLFRKAANCNLRPRQLVADLSKHGLRNELRRFYSEVRTQLPAAKLDGFPE
jgi:tetratricopeptide (TPR) repeat protein